MCKRGAVTQSVWFGRHTLHFPRLSLLVFGDLFHVFVVNVILAHKTVDPSVQQIDSWESKKRRDRFHQKQKQKFVRSVWDSSLSLFLFKPVVIVLVMLSSVTHLLTYQLSVNAIRDCHEGALSERPEVKGAGREASHSHFKISQKCACFSAPHLICSLRLPVCCCHDNLPPSFAVILCRCGGKAGGGSEGGKQSGTELIWVRIKKNNNKIKIQARRYKCN